MYFVVSEHLCAFLYTHRHINLLSLCSCVIWGSCVDYGSDLGQGASLCPLVVKPVGLIWKILFDTGVTLDTRVTCLILFGILPTSWRSSPLQNSLFPYVEWYTSLCSSGSQVILAGYSYCSEFDPHHVPHIGSFGNFVNILGARWQATIKQ